MRTLPTRVCNNGHPPLDKLAECEQGRLDGPLHRTDDDEADIKVFGYPRDEVGFQLGTLFAAEFRQLGVMDGVVL